MKVNAVSTATEGAHIYELRVYYEDTDAGGIVYHANYLRFCERARTEALRALGIPHAELQAQFGLMFVVRRVEMDYLRPARLDDSLAVVTLAEEIGGASLRLRQAVCAADGGELAVGHVFLACVAPGESRPRRIPPRWRDGLRAMTHGKDAGNGMIGA